MRSLEIFFWWGRSLARHDDSRHELCQTVKGSRMWFTGLRTIRWDEELLERGETRRNGYAPFRVKVTGSNPVGPTILRFRTIENTTRSHANPIFSWKRAL